ncbi:MAG: hypothetical protein M3Y86_01900 [Verrucomicrobiota bacterium]|nr:hypothetical protein [Verrucomicrobiota bacterium]
MPETPTPPDLFDLKMMPAWVNEPTGTNEYANFEGEEESAGERRGRGPQRGRDSRPRPPMNREQRERRTNRPDQRRPEGRGGERRSPRRDGERAPQSDRRPQEAPVPLPEVAVRFLPHPAAFESVIAQIKSGTVTYSVFALARMFLDKPERYDVQLTAAADSPLHQLGEGGPVATDARILEGSAFANAKDEFYTTEVTQTEPIKGNFSNVARDRASGTLLGPTNHHGYQPQLRTLYEQRYSRRMSFPDFQRQIEIVSDPAVVEQWKEQARSITTYTTKGEETPTTFTSAADAERHFRQTHLPTLLRSAPTLTISGVLSRRLPDRGLGRVIENAWAAEIRSPSKMMQELASGLRTAALHIFRHRKGMLFISPLRVRAFNHESAGVSASINSILEKLGGAAGMNRKQLADQLIEGLTEQAEIDRIKLSLAADLRWLISEGYVIEFNDGTLDLPRAKAPAAQPAPGAASAKTPVPNEQLPEEKPAAEAAPMEAEAAQEMVDSLAPSADEGSGIQVDQTVAALPPDGAGAPESNELKTS